MFLLQRMGTHLVIIEINTSITDEVLVRGSKKLISFPAAPGIMPESVQNILILEYFIM